MLYKYKNNKLLVDGSIGKVYRDQALLFKGNSYIAIKLFIKNTDNNSNIINIFEKQLTMREQCKFEVKAKNERLNPGVDHGQKIYTDTAASKNKTQKRKK